MVKDVKDLLARLDIGYPEAVKDTVDTNTWVFLSVTVNAFESA
jgi:hypothetical protein